MTLNKQRAREFLARGDLSALFVEELGWDRHNSTLRLVLDATTPTLHAVAEKRGMIAYHCPTPVGLALPDYSMRRRIEHQVAKAAHEHLIVFTDAAKETQVWQWVKREPGKPAACREHTLQRAQPGDGLLQKLQAIAFTLEEEELLSLPDVTRRARAGFDVERVTKRFYERFQKEHTVFLNFISGISESADHEWYASLMLNRNRPTDPIPASPRMRCTSSSARRGVQRARAGAQLRGEKSAIREAVALGRRSKRSVR